MTDDYSACIPDIAQLLVLPEVEMSSLDPY